MKKIIFLVIVVYFFSACNNADTKTKQTADSLNNSSVQYLKTFEQKVKTFPDSAGLRLQYAFALDSLNKFQTSFTTNGFAYQ